MSARAREARTCGELALRVTGLVAASLAMSGLVVWVWSTEITPLKVGAAWLGWCAAIRLYAVAADQRRPRAVCYGLALVPAAGPYVAVIGLYWTWWLVSTVS